MENNKSEEKPSSENPPQNSKPPCSTCPNASTGGAACAGCPYRKQCQSGQLQPDPTIALVKEKLSEVKQIILILSGKGGVG